MTRSPKKRSVNNQPGSEAAEPSPGQRERNAPSERDLNRAEEMYKNAAKKLARRRAPANADKGPADD